MELVVGLGVVRAHAISELGVALAKGLAEVHHREVGEVWHPRDGLEHIEARKVAGACMHGDQSLKKRNTTRNTIRRDKTAQKDLQ